MGCHFASLTSFCAAHSIRPHLYPLTCALVCLPRVTIFLRDHALNFCLQFMMPAWADYWCLRVRMSKQIGKWNKSSAKVVELWSRYRFSELVEYCIKDFSSFHKDRQGQTGTAGFPMVTAAVEGLCLWPEKWGRHMCCFYWSLLGTVINNW